MSRKISPTEQAPPQQLVGRLREILGLDHKAFAELLGVTRAAASRWEGRGGMSEPSAGTYISLGKLAKEEGQLDLALRFFTLGGVDEVVLKALVPEFDRTLNEYERAGAGVQATVDIPLVDNSFFRGEPSSVQERFTVSGLATLASVKSRIPFPKEAVPDYRKTIAVLAPDDHMKFIFRKGNIVAVQTYCPSFLLETLQDQEYRPIVAAYHEQRGPEASGYRQGLHLRTLRRSGGQPPWLTLETELGRAIAGAQAMFPAATTIAEGEEGYHSVQVRGNREWAILGVVVAWLGCDKNPVLERQRVALANSSSADVMNAPREKKK